MGVLVVPLFFTIMVVLAIRAPRNAVLALVFLAPWGGAVVDFGLRITAFQLTIAAVISVMLLRSLYQPGFGVEPVAARRLLVGLVVYAMLWSLLQLAFIPEVDIGQGALRLPLARAMIQIGLFGFNLAPALLVAWSLRTREDIEAAFRTYLWSALILGVIGWFQILMWYRTGINPLPINGLSDVLGGASGVTEGQFAFDLLNIKRMNSLAGEPRNLGGVCVFAMLLIQAAVLTIRQLPFLRLGLVWLFLLVTAALTYSSSAAVLWVFGSAVMLIATPFAGVRFQRTAGQVGAGLLAVIVPLALAVAAAQASGLPVLELASQRTLERFDSNGVVEDFDLAIIDFFKANPDRLVFGTGLGNVHLYAAPYLSPEFLWYAEGQVFTAKSTYLRYASELGVVGLAIFLSWYAVLLVTAVRAAMRNRIGMVAPLLPVGVTVLALYLVAGQFAGEFWCIAGLLAVLVNALHRERRADARRWPLGRAAFA